MKRVMKPYITPPDDGRFHCLRGCGDSWDHDPRLDVDCPTCGARAGVNCVAPSEHRKSSKFAQPHKARRVLAYKLNPCRCDAIWLAEHTTQSELFVEAQHEAR